MTETAPDERPQRRREYSGASSTLGIAALIVIAVGVALWLFEFRDSNTSGSGTSGYGVVSLAPSLNPTGKSPAAEVGRAAPDFRLQTPSGEVRTLSQYRGRTVLVNFWATWCVPCRTETPDLEAFFQRYGAAKDFMILGVNQQETAGDASSFTDQFGVSYPILLDSDGDVSQAYRAQGLPVSVLVNAQGVVTQIFRGQIKADQLNKLAGELG